MRFGTEGRFCGYVGIREGVAWFRLKGIGYQLFAPWKLPLFSERYGYRKPIARAFGWRLFNLPSAEQAFIDHATEAIHKAILGRRL